MASFFEKLKKGMGIDEQIENSNNEGEFVIEETKPIKKVIKSTVKSAKKAKKMEVKTMLAEKEEMPEEKIEKEDIEESPMEIPEETEEEIKLPEEKCHVKQDYSGNEDESLTEGQLAIDVYQTDNDLVIQSAVAGVRPEHVDILMEKDVLTIKGHRQKPVEENGDYFSQECFWGAFSREIIMPTEVDTSKIKAELKEGILTVRLPKISKEKKKKIVVTTG